VGRKYAITTAAIPFLVGLLIGWLVIGWWLWPVQQVNSAPWLMRAEYQERYLRLVAAYYRCTGDLSGVREALKGWNSEKLATQLEQLVAQDAHTGDIVSLAEALSLPVEKWSIASNIVDRDFFLWTILLSASPLVIAIVLALSPLLRNGKEMSSTPALGEGIRALDAELSTLLASESQQEMELPAAAPPPSHSAGSEYENLSAEEILADIFGRQKERLDRYAALSAELEDIAAADLVLKARRVLEQIITSNQAHP
jgi:hypothetical protein